MKSQLQRIGNSQGVIIPKTMLKQAGIEKQIQIQIVGQQIIIEPEARVARKNWEAQVLNALEKEGPHEGDPNESITNEFDDKEWTW